MSEYDSLWLIVGVVALVMLVTVVVVNRLDTDYFKRSEK